MYADTASAKRAYLRQLRWPAGVSEHASRRNSRDLSPGQPGGQHNRDKWHHPGTMYRRGIQACSCAGWRLRDAFLVTRVKDGGAQ